MPPLLSVIEKISENSTVSEQLLTYPGMQTVSSLKRIPGYGLIAAVSASLDLSLWSIESRTLVQKYSAALVTCGGCISFLGVGGPGQLLIGSSDGSVCLREVRRKEEAPRYQCVLIRFWDCPDPLDACPVTAALIDGDSATLLVGDAGCRVRFLSSLV